MMTENITIIQLFHWYTPNDGNWWNNCAEQAKHLATQGITHVYLPPAYKSALGNSEPGYATYDLYDLGEFSQKGTIRTKYGTKDEYLKCIDCFHEVGIKVIADIVLNHRFGGDEEEEFQAIAVNHDDRNVFVGEVEKMKALTKFTFPERNGKYSNFQWDSECFTGIDIDRGEQKNVIHSIVNKYGTSWEDVIEEEFGNYDYLMGADVEYRNEEVKQEIKNWGKWYVETTGIDGFRMDAVKHISPAFVKEWIEYMRQEFKTDFPCVSEYWRAEVEPLVKYLDAVEGVTQLFDVPLHYNFHNASRQGNNYDLRDIFNGSLLEQKPDLSVTFVENHDTQSLQSLESPVESWFKPLAYALILLREKGLPTVFYPCLHGAEYSDKKGNETYDITIEKVLELPKLMDIRKHKAYGNQVDYFDHPNVIGWVRQGDENREQSGCAVLMSNGKNGYKNMDMGKQNAHKTFKDVCGHVKKTVKTDENGMGRFLVKGGKVSVWVLK
jgi:alpha-amylase